MKVLWFTNIMLPDFAQVLQMPLINQGGWMPSLVSALHRFSPATKLIVACEGPAGQVAEVNGVQYIALGYRKRSRFSLSTSAAFIQSVTSCVRAVNPDIVHVHGSEGVYPTLPVEVFSGKPILISLQGIISGCYPHYTGCLTKSEVAPFDNWIVRYLAHYSIELGAENWRLRRGPREMEAIKKYHNFAGRTQWDRAWIHAINAKANYFNIGEVLRSEFYQVSREPSRVVRHSIYCSAAATYPLKGLHWLLRAVAFLKERYPDIHVRVANAERVSTPTSVIAKRRQSQYHRYLNHLILELGLEGHVTLRPSLTAAEVAKELAMAEIFCLPSLCENSPNSLGEAMLMGTPCVATYVGGVPSTLKNGEEGLLCPPADPASLADAIGQVFDDEKTATSRALRARETARQRYSPANVVNELLAVYERLGLSHRPVDGHLGV